jgi:hypothetical protein
MGTTVRYALFERFFMKFSFDKVINTIAGLGVPGLVLLVAMAVSGWAGAAAMTTALAALGGPLGMLGGIALLGVLALISWAIAEYGFEKIAVAVIKELKRKGKKREGVLKEIESYPISRGMKLKILDAVNRGWLP